MVWWDTSCISSVVLEDFSLEYKYLAFPFKTYISIHTHTLNIENGWLMEWVIYLLLYIWLQGNLYTNI